MRPDGPREAAGASLPAAPRAPRPVQPLPVSVSLPVVVAVVVAVAMSLRPPPAPAGPSWPPGCEPMGGPSGNSS